MNPARRQFLPGFAQAAHALFDGLGWVSDKTQPQAVCKRAAGRKHRADSKSDIVIDRGQIQISSGGAVGGHSNPQIHAAGRAPPERLSREMLLNGGQHGIAPFGIGSPHLLQVFGEVAVLQISVQGALGERRRKWLN